MTRRTVSALFALLLTVSMTAALLTPRTYAATTEQEQQLSEIEAKKAELQKQIDAAESSKAAVLDQKKLMDEQNDVIRQQISTVQSQIEDSNQRIAETQVKEEAQYQLFCKQVREEEERGSVSYWEVLFKATSFSDLLSRLDFINEVMAYDKQVMEDLKALQAQLAQEKADLETQKTDLSDAKSELEQKIADAAALVAQYEETQAGAQALYDAEIAQAAEIERQIQEAEKAAQDAANQNGTNVPPATSGGYIWPTDTRLVTSPFGPRSSPGGIGSTYHLGVDIGARYGSPIYATKSGTVILTGGPWGGGYGNYVVLDHGSGNTTLYAHMSSIAVGEGETVSQGQVIGYVGSTGNSTGPHLHYEIRENGSRIDPLTYLPGYIPYDW